MRYPALSFAIGGAMIAIAAYVVVAPFWLGRTITNSRVLDVAFALFFGVRGWMTIRRGRRAQAGASSSPPPAP